MATRKMSKKDIALAKRIEKLVLAEMLKLREKKWPARKPAIKAAKKATRKKGRPTKQVPKKLVRKTAMRIARRVGRRSKSVTARARSDTPCPTSKFPKRSVAVIGGSGSDLIGHHREQSDLDPGRPWNSVRRQCELILLESLVSIRCSITRAK
jgi:hypothetical protein